MIDEINRRDPRGKLSCLVPFRKIEILQDGRVAMCCFTWLPHFCGDLRTDSIQDIMSNVVRTEVQAGMRRGEFPLCTSHCPYLASYEHSDAPVEDLWPLVPLWHLEDALRDHMYSVYMTYDDSCNLQCPSCRKGLIWHNRAEVEDNGILAVHSKSKDLVNLLLSEGHKVQIHITGSGDPFASWIFWTYLQELAAGPLNSNLYISLSTNGVLMTRQNLEQIRPLWPCIDNVNVSVDAATEETYNKVRKGGNFQKLRENLASFDHMIADGCFPNLQQWQNNFVVQRDNFRELKQFVEWQLGYSSLTTIWTNLIAQWGHIDDESYNGMAVWRDGHPMREELQQILRDPIFRNPRVFLGNMSQIMP